MLEAYRDLLRAPQAGRLLAAKVTCKLASVGVYLPLLLLVEQVTESYAWAGVSGAAWSCGSIVAGPRWARMCDRRAPGPVVAWLSVAWAALVAALLAAASLEAAGVALAGVALMLGAADPPTMSVLRRHWDRIVPEEQARTAAAWENLTTEMVYVGGPLLAAGTLVLGHVQVSLVVCAVLMLASAGVFWACDAARAGESCDSDAGGRRRARAPWRPALGAMVAGFLWIVTYDMEVVAVQAMAGHDGTPASGAVLIAAWSAGGMAGAVLYGARRGRGWPRAELAAGLGLYGALTVLIALPVSWEVRWALASAAGLVSAAPFALLFLWVRDAVDARRRTEAYALLTAAMTAGGALGALAAGVVSDAAGPGWALTAAGAASVLAVPVAVAGRWRAPVS